MLETIGVYGVTSQLTTRRHEVGIRVALGALPRDVVRLLIGEGMRPVAVGIAAGEAGAYGTVQAIRTLLYGVGPADPFSFSIAAILLGTAVLLACWLPVHRGARADPVTALRRE